MRHRFGIALIVVGLICFGQEASARKVGPEFRINTSTATSQVGPTRVAALSTGGFVVAWKDVHFTGQDEPFSRTLAQRFTATGQRVGSEFAVGSFGDFAGPIAVIPINNGGFIIIVATDDGPKGQRYGGGGIPIGTAFPVPGARAAAGLANGGFVAASYDSSTNAVLGQRYTDAGVPVGSAFPVNVGGSGSLDVTALTNGGFVVVWSWVHDGSGYGVYGRRFDASATPASGVFQINTNTDHDQTRPAADGLANGGFVVTWQSAVQDGSRQGVYAQRFNASGARSGGEFRVNSYTASLQLGQRVSGLTDGGFVVVWQSYGQDGSRYGVYAKRYDVAGAPASKEFRVNSFTQLSQDGNDVAAFANGGFAITWSSESQNGIFGQRFVPD